MDFVTGLSISINWKRDGYKSILVIIDWFIKMVYYKPVNIVFNVRGLANVIINVLVLYHGFPDSIVINKAWFLSQNSSYCFAISLVLSVGFSPTSICKLTTKPKDRTIPWKPISKPLSISS